MTISSENLQKIRANMAQNIANELCSVQPMPSNLIADAYKAAKSQEQLIAEGYEPVEKSGLSIMWVKK